MSEGSCTYIILGKHVSHVFEDLRKMKAPNSWPLYSKVGSDRPLDHIPNVTSLVQVIIHVKPLFHP
jgi:hypothetical protein